MGSIYEKNLGRKSRDTPPLICYCSVRYQVASVPKILGEKRSVRKKKIIYRYVLLNANLTRPSNGHL